MQKKIGSWKIRHAFAREALLRSLKATDLLKITAVQNSAAAIWTRLKTNTANLYPVSMGQQNSSQERLSHNASFLFCLLASRANASFACFLDRHAVQ